MRNTIHFNLIKGQLEINNSEINISYNYKKFSSIIIKFFLSILFILSTKRRIENFETLVSNYDYIKFSLFILVTLFLIYEFIRSLFKDIWINKIELNEIVKVRIENNEDEIEVEIKLIKNNGRAKLVKLKKEENQLETFLETLKKRNTRIKIEYINNE